MKMKYLKVGILMLAVSFFGIFVCQADDTTKEFPVMASISQQLELNGWVKEMGEGQTDPGTQGTLRDFPCTLDFSQLTSDLTGGTDAGCLYSQTWYAVFLVAKTSGRSYRLVSTGQRLNGKGDAAGYYLPDVSFVLTPAYQEEDEWQWGGGGSAPQGPDKNPGASVGSQDSAVGEHVIYDSGSGGAAQIIRAFYSLPPYPDPTNPIDTRPAGWEPVPSDQHFGEYEGSVTISLVLTGA